MLQIFILGLVLAASSQAAIFGQDDRYSPKAGQFAFRLSRSTAVAVLSSNVSEDKAGRLQLETDSLNKFLCKTERFAEEPSLSYACSGFLVAPDLIVTAGHCMVNTGETRDNSEDYCKVFSWLFDYRNDLKSGQVQLKDIPKERFYHCKRVVYAVKDDHAPFRDFAIVQLDRAVPDRAPLKIAASPLALQEPLTAIGYPLGMPVKVSPFGRVLINQSEKQSFLTNLDVFDGNSGSPVLNRTGEVVGILVGGTPAQPFVERPPLACALYNRCDEQGGKCLLPDGDVSRLPGYQGTGSEVQRIAPVQEFLKSLRR